MEVVGTSETSDCSETTRRHIPQGSHLCNMCLLHTGTKRENIKPQYSWCSLAGCPNGRCDGTMIWLERWGCRKFYSDTPDGNRTFQQTTTTNSHVPRYSQFITMRRYMT